MSPVKPKHVATPSNEEMTLRVTLHSLQEMPELMVELGRFGSAHQLSPDTQYRVGLIIDELLTNCFNHGPCAKKIHPKIELKVTNRALDLEITISDSGQAFDPTLYDCPPCTDPKVIKPGGVGLCLVRNLVSTMRYQRQRQQNLLVLTITKTL